MPFARNGRLRKQSKEMRIGLRHNYDTESETSVKQKKIADMTEEEKLEYNRKKKEI